MVIACTEKANSILGPTLNKKLLNKLENQKSTIDSLNTGLLYAEKAHIASENKISALMKKKIRRSKLPREDYWQKSSKDWYVLPQGSFHGNEVVNLKKYKYWYGIFLIHDSIQIRPDQPQIKYQYDGIVDDYSGKNVSSSTDDSLLVFFGTNKELDSRQFKSSEIIKKRIFPGQSEITQINKKKLKQSYMITGYGNQSLKKDESGNTPIESYTIGILAYNSNDELTEQIVYPLSDLYYYNYFDGEGKLVLSGILPYEIVWAGDLDQDGKLDLIISDENHYNMVDGKSLWLSSLGNKNKVVGLAHCFTAFGC